MRIRVGSTLDERQTTGVPFGWFPIDPVNSLPELSEAKGDIDQHPTTTASSHV